MRVRRFAQNFLREGVSGDSAQVWGPFDSSHRTFPFMMVQRVRDLAEDLIHKDPSHAWTFT